jgi:hypothetical protein
MNRSKLRRAEHGNKATGNLRSAQPSSFIGTIFLCVKSGKGRLFRFAIMQEFESFEDLEAWLKLIVKKAKRVSEKQDTPEQEQA